MGVESLIKPKIKVNIIGKLRISVGLLLTFTHFGHNSMISALQINTKRTLSFLGRGVSSVYFSPFRLHMVEFIKNIF